MAGMEASLTAMLIECPTLGRVEVDAAKAWFSSSENECDLCGSHGEVTASFSCDCGTSHEIYLHSW